MTNFYREYLKTSVVGLEVGLCVIIGGGLGYLVERYFDMSPWGLIMGVSLGIGAAARTLYHFSKKYLKENFPL